MELKILKDFGAMEFQDKFKKNWIWDLLTFSDFDYYPAKVKMVRHLFLISEIKILWDYTMGKMILIKGSF